MRADKLAKKLPAEINETFTRGQEVRLEDTPQTTLLPGWQLSGFVAPTLFTSCPGSLIARRLLPSIAQADQLGRLSDALAAYTECAAACDAALGTKPKAAKAIAKIKEQSEARISQMQIQSKRSVMVSGAPCLSACLSV